jgi:hypothetical protein
MDRIPGVTACLLGGLLMLEPLARLPALAQTAPPPGSTINGTVPSSDGNVWNGFDHQPTPADTAPVTGLHRRAHVNRTLGKLDRQLLNDPLPKIPAGAPQADGN